MTGGHGGPLEGVRVVDLTRWVAGPSCSLLLALLGAEVIRIESSGRVATPSANGPADVRAIFNELNAGKLGIELNLKHPKGVELGKRLLGVSDVFLYNMRQSAADRLGLGPEVLLGEVNPGLVILCMSLSGATGQEREYLGYAPLFTALSGVSYLTGHADGPPCENPTWPDHELATWGALSVISALLARQQTGRGAFIDLSGREALTWLVGETLVEYQLTGRLPERYGNRHPWMAPHNCYPCLGDDRWVSIAVASDAEWQALCRVMGHDALAGDPRFATPEARWAAQDALDPIIAAWTSQEEVVSLVERCQAAGVAAVLVHNAEDIYGARHLWERAFFQTVHHPAMGVHTMIGPPWKFSQTPAKAAASSPAIGEHNDHVYGDLLGLDSAAIARLQQEGAIA